MSAIIADVITPAVVIIWALVVTSGFVKMSDVSEDVNTDADADGCSLVAANDVDEVRRITAPLDHSSGVM